MAGARMGGALRGIHQLFDEGTAAGLADGPLLERFLDRDDDAAFATLVERHGPIILRVCRSALTRPEDVEDAFQATFLVLVCKARSIRGRQALGAWLQQVAHRVAIRAGVDSARRRAYERRAVAMQAADSSRDQPGDDWRQVLHEELAELSERYRRPLLLCDLEGKTHAEAAAVLGCGTATVQRRLTRARAILRSRLTRRGVTLMAGGLAAGLGRSTAGSVTVPPGWVDATVASARAFASRAGRLAVGQVNDTVTSAEGLARRCLNSLAIVRSAAIAGLGIVAVAMGGLAWGLSPAGSSEAGPAGWAPGEQAAERDSPRQEPGPQGKSERTFVFRGRVEDPDGHPVAGAAIYLFAPSGDPNTVRATSGPDGRFRFEVTVAAGRDNPPVPFRANATIVALASGYAFAVAGAGDERSEATLTLARDDVPIAGRVVDLEGRPVAGAVVKVLEVRLPVDPAFQAAVIQGARIVNAVRPAVGSMAHSLQSTVDQELRGQIRLLEERREWDTLDGPVLHNQTAERGRAWFLADATTDADGRFRMTGIGRGRVARLRVEGPAIEATHLLVRARPGMTIRKPASNHSRNDPLLVYPATFEHAVAPTRVIEGVVTDRRTGRPLSGMPVHSRTDRSRMNLDVSTETDEQGHYRLVGLPLGREGTIVVGGGLRTDDRKTIRAEDAVPLQYRPNYFRAEAPVGTRPGDEPIRLDFAMEQGVCITGRLVDRTTGRTLDGIVTYFPFADNPHHRRLNVTEQTRRDLYSSSRTRDDGRFSLLAPPGPGVLAARVLSRGYAVGVGADAIKARRADWHAQLVPDNLAVERYHVLQWVDPSPDDLQITQDLMAEPARPQPAK